MVFGLTPTLQRRAVAKGRRHSKACRAEGFLEEILPPVPASLPPRYVPCSLSLLSRAHDTFGHRPPIYLYKCMSRTLQLATQQLAICHILRALELELLKICSLKTTVSALEEHRHSTMSVASKSSLFRSRPGGSFRAQLTQQSGYNNPRTRA